jgi:benzaldehyde dehydrogenase (NAD)
VLAGVTATMPAFREGIFGPMAPVVVVRDEDEAVAAANDTESGLVAAIQTGSLGRGHEVARRLRTGIVHINDQTLNNDAFAPFGGVGASGNGSRYGSQSSWDEFTQWQWITAREEAHAFPF